MTAHDFIVRVGNRSVVAIDPATGKLPAHFIPEHAHTPAPPPPPAARAPGTGRVVQTALAPYLEPVSLTAAGVWQDTGCHVALPRPLDAPGNHVHLEVHVPVWVDFDLMLTLKLVRVLAGAPRFDIVLPRRDFLFGLDVLNAKMDLAHVAAYDVPRQGGAPRYELWVRAPRPCEVRLGGHGALTLRASEVEA